MRLRDSGPVSVFGQNNAVRHEVAARIETDETVLATLVETLASDPTAYLKTKSRPFVGVKEK
ncbi:hypothetical protein GCM10007872_32300 [Gluconobacter sphaericus NBRC 12467]|uniref:Uncharacterized protein n=1 Tax=Gluconobacter sphaericus NBRC 12467 TaxID=1307951 RepID=A0AA37WB59_9PROT|nr:hypothetical protein AA12467_2667 [Gluconobacter sphaericus NBRC 12467]GEB43687.1 hypothetical protein GSP01_24690 [Gluconobacter sphaericus NBRC 12467]GLQ86315.1 hypothetical protein GCM10007872_32300 [Gluconobacter sphaericus NBRC 12467]